MSSYDDLLTRRSVRSFVPGKKISAEDMKKLLRAAMYAPSARNCQPWEFIVVDNDDVIREISGVHPYASFLKDAGQAVVVCGNLEEQYDKDYWTVDCAAAAENLLLACHSLGLGACWCGIYPNQERIEAFTRLFDLPTHIKPLALVVIGYPRLEARQPSDRFNETKVHYNKY